MSLNAILRKGVKIIDKQTKSFQGSVLHKQISSQDECGEKTFSPAAGTTRKAIIVQEFAFTRMPDGTRVPTQASLLFTTEFGSPLVSGIDRAGPIDPRDELVLPDGSTGPIVRVSGPLDPPARPFILQVWLGAR